MQSKNLTIMFTDIKGYTSRTSKLSREKLHELLKLHDDLILPVFKKFDGKVIKTIGDAFMVTFESPTDAVLCGIEIQKVLEEHNKKSSDEIQLEVRVALNSGEVTLKDNDIFGEAVNIAARLEGIADAGDIYFTESIFLSMNKNEIPTAEVGHRHFKGVPGEVKVYKVLNEGVCLKKSSKKGYANYSETFAISNIMKKNSLQIIGAVVLIAVVLIVIFQSGFLTGNTGMTENTTTADGAMLVRETENPTSVGILSVEELAQKFEQNYSEAEQAIERGEMEIARQRIDKLREIAPNLEDPQRANLRIDDLERRFFEKFEQPDGSAELINEEFERVFREAEMALQNREKEIARQKIDKLWEYIPKFSEPAPKIQRVEDLERRFQEIFK